MKILHFPHPALFTKCEEVTVFDSHLKDKMDQMFQLMSDSNGIGLSGNQVGLLERFFIMRAAFGEQFYCINPSIESHYPEKANMVEGCLSSPGDFLTLNRSNKIILSYQNINGTNFSRIFTGIHAVCIQHEIDHLDGKSFMQAEEIEKKEKKRLRKKWSLP
jgi:peptide deformylase